MIPLFDVNVLLCEAKNGMKEKVSNSPLTVELGSRTAEERKGVLYAWSCPLNQYVNEPKMSLASMRLLLSDIVFFRKREQTNTCISKDSIERKIVTEMLSPSCEIIGRSNTGRLR